MFSNYIDQRVFADVSWWHWVLTVPLLVAHLSGYPWAIEIAMALCVAVGVYFFARLKEWRPYPVQVRIAYLGLLSIGLLPGMHWMHWVQLFGTSAMVTIGYCPLIRMLSLAPLNRDEQLTLALVGRVFIKEPCSGGLVQWNSASASQSIGCCSLPRGGNPIACSLANYKSTPQEKNRAQAY